MLTSDSEMYMSLVPEFIQKKIVSDDLPGCDV